MSVNIKDIPNLQRIYAGTWLFVVFSGQLPLWKYICVLCNHGAFYVKLYDNDQLYFTPFSQIIMIVIFKGPGDESVI